MKGIIFGGCSFTWGQGLYYYSGLETLKEPAPDTYDGSLVTYAHRLYMSTLRYPRLVANYFNTFEIVSKKNGGSETQTIEFLDQLFNLENENNYTILSLAEDKVAYNEIEYIIIQTSQPHRNRYYFNFKGENHHFCVDEPSTKNTFYEWLLEEKKCSFEDWKKDLSERILNDVRNAMHFYEDKGIKTLILCWEEDYLQLIKDDIWLYNRFIPLKYNNEIYDCIRHMMNKNEGLTINNDFEHFINPPKDHHPSLKCHQIIAENIIKRIENDINFDLNKKTINLVYDSWDEKNNCPLEPNCKIIYEDSLLMPIDSIMKSFNIYDDIERYKLSEIKNYPDKNFFYFITIMPNLIEKKLLNNESPLLPEVIEYWKSFKNLNIIFMNDQESESYQTFLLLHNWTKKLNLNQNQLWLSNNNPKLNQYKIELNSDINVHSTQRLIEFTTKSFENSIGKIDFNLDKKGEFFLCHNKRPRPHRYGILCLLKKYDILKDVDWSLVNGWLFDSKDVKGFYSCVFNENDINDLSSEIEYFKNIDQKKSKYEEDKTWFDNREDFYTVVNWGIIYEKQTYENSYVNIATETEFCSNTIHITEKSFKPFYALQFPIIIANHEHIKEMKRLYDFDFFDDVINHDYDNIENPRERLFRIFNEIQRIYSNKEFFIDFYNKNKERFIKNQNKMIELSYGEYDRKFLINLIKN